VTDILYAQKTQATSTYNIHQEWFYQRFDSRVVTLAFTFRFGKQEAARLHCHACGVNNEKHRAG
jgi:hypothetical protein